MFLRICICMSDKWKLCFRGPRTITFSKILHLLDISATLKKMYLCICIFVFVYLHIRHSGTLFLRSLYHYLCKNITYVRHICNFDRNCICVFVYLYVCMYLHIRYLGTFVAQVVPMCYFDRSCICVFLHLLAPQVL